MASSSNWIILITFGVLLMVCVSKTDDSAAESKDTNTDDDENTIKIYKRLIPADVLRGKSPYYLVYYQMFSSNSNVRTRFESELIYTLVRTGFHASGHHSSLNLAFHSITIESLAKANKCSRFSSAWQNMRFTRERVRVCDLPSWILSVIVPWAFGMCAIQSILIVDAMFISYHDWLICLCDLQNGQCVEIRLKYSISHSAHAI